MSSDLLNQLLEQAKTLSEEERRLLATCLLAGAETQASEKKQTFAVDNAIKYRAQEYEWIREHTHEYPGQWVALDGDRLYAHGSSAREVFEEAKRAGATLPYMVRIDSPDEVPFTGGW